MTTVLLIAGAVLALAIGIWIGIGAPGWPHEPSTTRRHTTTRNLNPIAWGRGSSRKRVEVRDPHERRPRLR